MGGRKDVITIKLTIKGNTKEIAALVLAIQKQQNEIFNIFYRKETSNRAKSSVTYDFGCEEITNLVVTTDRNDAIRHMEAGKHIYFLPQMMGREYGLFILGAPLDKQAQYLETTQNLTTSEAEEHLSDLEKSSREQCNQ